MSTFETHNASSIPFIKLETQEIDELAYHIKHADVELIQTGGSKSPSSLTLLSFDNIELQVGEYGASSISNATIDKEKSGVVYKITGDYPTTCNGYEIDRTCYMFQGNNSDQITINKGPCRWAYITFKSDYFEESLIKTTSRHLDAKTGKSSLLKCGQQLYLNSLYGVINEITALINSNPEIIQDTNIIKGMESSLLDSQILLLSNTSYPDSKLGDTSKRPRESIIRQSIDFFKANYYEPVHVLDLCNALNVRIRTLYYAFQEFYGISPIRYLRLLRYAKARRDLLNADPKKTTVANVAARWHFWHFGRFSVEYGKLYGESPSETLSNGVKI